jgi:chaperonin GroEL
MPAGKKILSKQKARLGILSGIIEAGKTAALTFGPQGRTVMFDKGSQPRLTKDGITVLNTIQFTDELKNFGAQLLKEASGKSNYAGGDGSTSTAILTTELCCAAQRLLNQGIDINDLKVGFKLAKEKVLEELKNYKQVINGPDDIYHIAKISANNDEAIAKIIADAFDQIGDNGIVSIADSLSRTGETSIKITSGIEFDRGFLSSLSVNSPNDQAIFVEPAVILSSQIVNKVEDFTLLLQNLILKHIPIILIAPDFSDDVLAWFREQLSKKLLTGALILAPGVSKESIATNLLDFSIMMGGRIVYQDVDIDQFDIEKDICSCDRIIITKGNTTVIAPDTDKERFDKHIENLQAKVKVSSSEYSYSEYEIETIKERIARMTGGVATIMVGALTSPELGEKKDRYEDAVSAVRATINDGYVIGGATPLLKISYDHKFVTSYNIGVTTAIKEYMKAIRKPAKLLIEYSAEDSESIIPEILKNSVNFGYNAKERRIEDLLKAGIIDPYKVVVNSIIYSTNVAEAFMSVDAVILSDVPNLNIEPLDSILQESGILGI